MTYEEELKQSFPSICYDIYCGVHCPDDWKPIVEQTLQEIVETGIPTRIIQIKSKWSRLRIYHDNEDEAIRKILAEADRKIYVLECAKS